jgi:hypothetical protein
MHGQVVEIYFANGNNKWQDSEAVEMEHLAEYKGKGGTAPIGYKKIWIHVVYDVRYDGRHKRQLVAGGHLTDPNTENVYSEVGIHLINFLSQLNVLELWGIDVGNTYLEDK